LPDDLSFTRSKGEIRDCLIGLLRAHSFPDGAIGPDGSFMAKLETEIGCRMAHMKKEQVTDPGKFNAAPHIRPPLRQQTWPPTAGARTWHAMLAAQRVPCALQSSGY
jgi:hypothetical protein